MDRVGWFVIAFVARLLRNVKYCVYVLCISRIGRSRAVQCSIVQYSIVWLGRCSAIGVVVALMPNSQLEYEYSSQNAPAPARTRTHTPAGKSVSPARRTWNAAPDFTRKLETGQGSALPLQHR